MNTACFFFFQRDDDRSGRIQNCGKIDPSGYVYDTETDKRLAGVKTTLYWISFDEKDENTVPSENEYGTLWNADEWDQINPITTDSEGRYAWDVPEGWWRVSYEKNGYETAWSDWMQVPPPQTDVNIGLVSNGMQTTVMKGDVNSDDEVTALDRLLLTRYLAGWQGYGENIDLDAADINNDSKVTAMDRLILSRYLAEWPGYEIYFDK